MAREPGYCRHKATNQAFVRFNGKAYYLGEYGSDESKRRYDQLKAEWLVNRHSEKFTPKATGPTMAQLSLAYLDFAEGYYKASSELVNLKLALNPVAELYGTLPANQFGIVQYRAIREWWLTKPLRRGIKSGTTPKKVHPEKDAGKCSRQYVNKQMKRLLRVIKWAVGEGMIPPAIHQALQCVAPLKFGRCEAPEAEPVLPVDSAAVDAAILHLTPVVADMVRFQQLVGCRPGEVCCIKPAMVDRSSDVWQIKLERHKTAYRGKQRIIYCGPKAQAILKKYLLRGADDYCFSPIESEKQRRQAATDARVTPLSCGNKPGTNRISRKPKKAPSACYTAGTYARAIRYACLRAKLEPWAPNQLRHSAATAIRSKFGLDAASVVLGHCDLQVTQVYAEADKLKAIEVARQIG